MIDSNKVFFPNLEGLRFFAFFVVFINHASGCLGYNNHSEKFAYFRSHFLWNGDLGVSFFFVLSGFLITYLLLKEKDLSGRVNIKNFYMRRVLRIWPLYFLIIFLCLVIFPMFINIIPKWFPIGVDTSELNPWFYLTFTGNFDYIYNGISNVLIGVLWSVSVEEQFYLFWPLIIAFVPRKYLLKTFVIIILGSIAYRFFGAKGVGMLIKYHSLSSVSDLATGALIAYLACQKNFTDWIANIPKYAIILVYCLLFILVPLRFYVWEFGYYYDHVASITPVIFSSLFAFIILEQNYAKHSFYKISNWRVISSFGKYTYGMYCYHMLSFFCVLFIFHRMGVNVVGMSKYTFLFAAFTSFFSTLLISELSYTYYESFFLKMKNRFALIKKN
ncbi:MAG: acyltransferase [Bacteroidetes bacterium]|nr:acyltransferase [Bacteroidota bacterium]